MRLIHIVENLDKGAVENWLVNVFLESKRIRPQWRWTFYCILGRPGRLDERVRAAGGEIIYAPVSISQKTSFLRHLRKTLKAGDYDVIHAHHDFLSGFYMMASAGLRGRKIIHVHNNDEGIPVGSDLLRQMLLPVFRRMAFFFSDDIVGISEYTLQAFRGRYTGRKPRFRVLYYGINMDRFARSVDRESFRRAHSLPTDSRLLLCAGRMIHEKNPVFVVDILKSMFTLRQDVYAVFVGKGDLEQAVMDRACELGVEEHIRMIGWSDDIPDIMKACDVFVFPRLETPKEGLGLVVVEAQCAGLPVFITGGIVQDAVVLTDMAHWLKPENPDTWAQLIGKSLDQAQISQSACLAQMKQSHFSIDHATENLLRIYEETMISPLKREAA
jgi:glycosyltransferase involved in cell wall biosynthesis